MSDDPFANLNATATKDADEGAVDADAYFEAEMTIDEEDFEQPQERQAYVMPEDGSWVPVTIISAKIDQRTMNVMVPGEDGEEQPTPKEVDRFALECQHASSAYGERAYPYLLSAPAFDLKLPSRRGSWTKSSGRKLLAATRVTKPGQRITPDTLPELAEAMVGKTVMAKIRHVVKENKDAEPLKDDKGGFVKARVNEADEFIKIVERDGELVFDESGKSCPVGAEALIKVDDYYLIPDADGRMVKKMVTTTRTFDNLQDDVAPVPARDITYTKLDGKNAKGEVTMETVGAMTTRPVKPGTEVSVLVKGGELVRVTWIGTEWNEVEPTGGADLFKG